MTLPFQITEVGRTASRKRLRVLVVDDSEAQRRLISAILRRLDLDVVSAASGQEALDLCTAPEGASIRMILSDWQMPGMDGPNFCRAFRALPRDSYAYFILMTSASDRAAKAGGLDAGADDFLTRPVDLPELRARIRSAQRILAMEDELILRNQDVEKTLGELQTVYETISQDLLEARKLQQSFLPPQHCAFGEREVSLRLLACNQIGGDLVGYFTLPDDRIALFSFDVSGHGIASALLTGRLSALFSGQAQGVNIAYGPDGTVLSPPEVIERLNAFMVTELVSDIYFTAVLAYVDPASGEVSLCQAGHPHPLIRRADGQVDRVGEGGPPVGLFETATFEETTETLGPGDLLLVYSDGLTECEDTWGDMLEEDGLTSLLAGCDGGTEEAMTRLEVGLERHVGLGQFQDDVSMIAIKDLR